MDKCLVTTLKGNVTDTTGLEKFGEATLTLPEGGGSLSIQISPSAAFKSLGTASYLNNTLTWQNKTNVVFDKYNVTLLNIFGASVISQDMLDQLVKISEYAPLTFLKMSQESDGIVNINTFKNISKTANITLDGNTRFVGDATELINKANSLIGLTITPKPGNTNPNFNNFTFNINKINQSETLNSIMISNSSGDCSGNLVNFPKNVKFFSTKWIENTNFTWSGTRPSTSSVIALENVNLGNYVDAMLIEQATHEHNPLSAESWHSKIKVVGTRTSASDAAVQTLKSKGVTIMVNNVEL